MDSYTITFLTGVFPIGRCLVSFIINIFYKIPVLHANRLDLGRTPLSAASDLGLHCLPSILLVVSRLNGLILQNQKQLSFQHCELILSM